MILKAFFVTFVVFLFYNQCCSTFTVNSVHDGIVVEETSDSRLYMASFIRTNRSNAWISCTGAFIGDNHIVTAASCVHGEDLSTLIVRSGQTGVWLLGSGTPHFIQEIRVHPNFKPESSLEFNLAVVRLDPIVQPKETVTPRSIDKITPNRFCTMMGWEGHNSNQNSAIPLQMFPVAIGNAVGCNNKVPEAHCSMGEGRSTFKNCGGLLGAPLFCAGASVSGIVVQDHFCAISSPVGGSFLSLGEHKQWIEEAMRPIKSESTTSAAPAQSLSFSKLLMSLPLLFGMKLFPW